MSIAEIRNCASRRRLADLLAEVAAEFGVTPEELKSPRRSRPLPQVRAEFCRRAWALNEHSIPQIGSVINRDHSTVLYVLGKRPRKPSWQMAAE